MQRDITQEMSDRLPSLYRIHLYRIHSIQNTYRGVYTSVQTIVYTEYNTGKHKDRHQAGGESYNKYLKLNILHVLTFDPIQ